MFTTIKEDVSLEFASIVLTGDIKHNATKHALVLASAEDPDEIITTNPAAYGLEAQDDTVFIKDWSEHSGLAASLVAAGVVEIVRAFAVGPFQSRAYEVRVLAAETDPAAVAGRVMQVA